MEDIFRHMIQIEPILSTLSPEITAKVVSEVVFVCWDVTFNSLS